MKSELLMHLTNSELVNLLTLSHRSLACQNHDDLKSLVQDLNSLIYFVNAVCAQGNVLELIKSGEKEPKIDVCDVSYPAGYLDLYFENEYYYTDAVFREFITCLSPVNWLEVDKKCGFSYPASVMALDFNMNDGWTHGTVDPENLNSTVFFFGGPKAEHDTRSKKILEYIIPFYSEAHKRVMAKSSKPSCTLTSREIEVLNWIKEGKSSWEISVVLGVGKRTIDFHVKNIKQKLNAATRAQAVAIGLQNRIIEF